MPALVAGLLTAATLATTVALLVHFGAHLIDGPFKHCERRYPAFRRR